MTTPEVGGGSGDVSLEAARSVGGVRVVRLGEWDELMARLGGSDTYTQAAYHRASALLEPPGTVPVLVHHRDASGEVALPLLLRPLRTAIGWDAISAYGYGGPVGRGEPDVVTLGAALDEWARANSVVTTFLRLHPVFGNAHLVPATAELVQLGPTVLWDVSRGRDLASCLHPHHRRAVRRADRLGVEVTVVPRPPSLDGFRELYEMTMRRQEADSFFFFPTPYWEALVADAVPLQPVLVEARLDGQLIAALLCFVHGSQLHYHLGASDDAARSVGASHRCFLTAAEWAQECGVTGFHLGGGLGGSVDSPLLSFKHRFDPGSRMLPFHIAKIVHDRDRYRALAGSDATAGFFPPWRRSA